MKVNLMKQSTILSKMKLILHMNLKLPKMIQQLKLRRKKHEWQARETDAE